ncbi:tail assembly protein [Rhodobacter phage RcTitan]|uniref:VWFA domain-containing protein n=1 Tax=Rhodobacter phage RcTitan TaxID=1662330 RepID=A0A0K1LKT9_9CAUD|nr:tail assembly protein [Rhodobacter phage RcTitan]AKU43039.1 hypothetical protein RCTITAN_22 [Rhodobacter phage RcTitan]
MVKLSFAGFEDHSFIPYPPFVMGNETLEFLTDIVLTHDGSEDRTQNREIARQSVSFKVRTDLLNRQSPFNLSLQNIRGPWGVPLWHEAQIVGTVSGTSVACDTTLSDFRVDGLAIVLQNNKLWQVVRIVSISGASIAVTPSLPLMRNAIVAPITSGIVRGEISNEASGYQSVYSLLYDVLDPKPFPTKLAPLFALDVSGSMAGSKLETAKAELYDIVLALKGASLNSNVKVDLGISLWSTVGDNHSWPEATEADFDEALAIIAAATTTGGTTPLIPFQFANLFFGTIAPNPGDRKDIMFFITDAGASTTAARAEALAMITRVAPYDPPRDVDIYAINIDVTSTTEALKVDNASGGNITIVDAENPTAMFDRFIAAIEPIIGKQHKGFEVITSMPIGSRSISKSITKIEDAVDFDLGRFETLSPWLNSRVGSNHGFFIDGLDELASFKRFLYRRAGKQGAFFLPTFEHDIRVSSFAVDMLSAFIENDDFAEYFDGRTQIAIRFVDDTWQTVEITGATPTLFGGYELTFEKPIQKGLQFIERVCYMGKARFDTDRFEISYVGDNCAEASVNMLELNP